MGLHSGRAVVETAYTPTRRARCVWFQPPDERRLGPDLKTRSPRKERSAMAKKSKKSKKGKKGKK
jgi:hypothetical protein